MSGAAHNKNTDAKGNRFEPSAYHLDSIEMVNHRGEGKFIENMVVKFSISESLYSPTCVLFVSIKDSVNFFESFPCIGQETIKIILKQKEHNTDIEKTLEMKFFVKDYPTYGRAPQQNHTQVYRIKAISEQAFISGHKKISRAYEYQPTSSIIQNILERDCNLALSDFTLSGETKSKIKWICPYMTPFDALEQIRARSYDSNGAPYYLFQTISGQTNFVSHSAIVAEPIYQSYFDARQFSSDPNTEKDYVERATRILDCASNIKLAKLEQSIKGAYASETYALDYTTKSYKQKIYTYDHEQVNTLEQNPTISEKFVFSDGVNTPVKRADEFTSAHVDYIATNTGAYKDEVNDDMSDSGLLYNDLSTKGIAKLNSYRAIANSTTHDITLFGDLQINPGRVIELLFPKALDPEQLKEYLETDASDVYDRSLSGKYFITATEHKFEAGEYYVKCRVKRDSTAVEIK